MITQLIKVLPNQRPQLFIIVQEEVQLSISVSLDDAMLNHLLEAKEAIKVDPIIVGHEYWKLKSVTNNLKEATYYSFICFNEKLVPHALNDKLKKLLVRS